ncbi:hypothetical protein IMSAG249_00389 [Lachnospiraceae bacterium]|nr:hypothetical protein IMSAG249_00389 [Lachnospiraceae bacterium]
MGSRSLEVGNIKKIVSGLIGTVSVALCIFLWYRGGFMIVSESYKVKEIPIHNILYVLAAGDNVRQGFQARDEYLTGIEVMLVNTSPESTGEIVVQVLDMWGDVLGEGRRPLAEIEAGVFVTVPLRVEMNREGNEEFQVCIFSENASIIPNIVLVPDEDDFEDNTLCYYNEDLVGDCGLIVGYNYGREEYVGYRYQEKSIIWITIAKIIAILLIGGALTFLVLGFQTEQLKRIFLNWRIFSQLTIISFFVEAFLFAAVFNKMMTAISIPVWVYVAFFVPLILYLWSAFLFVKSIRMEKKGKRFQVDRYALIIVLVCFASRLPLFSHLQRWDSGVYYAGLRAACVNFDFSFESVWNYFRLASHPTFSYSFFMLIGEFLFPAKVTGVLLVNLLMTAVALVFIYKMLRGYWCHMHEFQAMVFTIIISVIPLFWGTSSYVNVDYTLIIFFIYLMYAEYKEQKILMTFWTIALLLNKETGWPIVAGYYIVYLIKLWKGVKEKQLSRKIAGIFRDKIVWGIFAGVLAVCGYIIQEGGLTGWYGVGVTRSIFASREMIAEKGMTVNAFGIYPEYIAHRLAQIFILNFMWIPTLIIVASLIFCVVKHMRALKKIENMGGMIGAFVMFVLFSTVYITAALARYTIFSTVILWLTGLLLLYYVWGNVFSKVRIMGGCAVVILLLVVQNFIYIDPFSNIIFDRLESGKGKILCTDLNTAYYGDSLVNNYRYSYLDRLLNKLLAEADYSKDKQIALWASSDDQSYINSIYSLSLGWDSDKKKRVIMDEKSLREKIIPLNTVPMEELQNGKKLNKETILYFLPYYDRDEDEFLSSLSEYYQISERKEISNWGGTLSYYILF